MTTTPDDFVDDVEVIPFESEILNSNLNPPFPIGNCYRRRSRVIGGWIIESMVTVRENLSISTVFIPDPNHQWKIK